MEKKSFLLKLTASLQNAFLASGGDGFVSFKNGKDAETGPTDFEALVDYIKNQKNQFSLLLMEEFKK